MNSSFIIAIAACAAAILVSSADAAPVTFMGEDLNPGGDPNTLSSYPNSSMAQAKFFTNLVGVGTETFDSIAVGTTNPNVSFVVPSGTVLATLTGGTVDAGSDGAGRYPISGSNYLFAGTGSFTTTFSMPIAAFGFYGTDIGDFGGALTLKLTDSNNVVTTLSANNMLGTCTGTPCSDPTSGSVLYYGFYDTTDTYTSVSFLNNSSVDNFGFDNFSVGTLNQILPICPDPISCPEPSSLALISGSLLGVGVISRRWTVSGRRRV